ncbi:MAG: hypothetical protein E7K72_19030 [Roseomonas mucosa]|nr:hypothetical protein [Roseomonas mucosa]
MAHETFRPAEYDCHGCGRHVVDATRSFPLPAPLHCSWCRRLGVTASLELLAWRRQARVRMARDILQER